MSERQDALFQSSTKEPLDSMLGVGSPTSVMGMASSMSEEDKQLVRWVFRKYTIAKRYRGNFDKDWDRFYRLYAGMHWEAGRPEWKSTPVINFIFSTIETIIPIMTDGKPVLTAVANDPSAVATAPVISKILENIWSVNDMQMKLPIIVKNSLKYGTAFAKVWFNHQSNEVSISIVDPRHIFPSPGALEIEDAEYVIFAASMPYQKVRRDFAGNPRIDEVQPGEWDPDLRIEKQITSQRRQGGMVTTVSSTDGSVTQQLRVGDNLPVGSVAEKEGFCTVIEMWRRTPENPAGEVIIVANGVLLKQTPNPFKHGKFPFVKFVDYLTPSSFWGMGEVQQVEKLQEEINRRRSQIIDILRICANPPLLADADSGISPKALTARPGLILYKNRGTDVRWLQAPNLPPSLFQLQELDKRDFDTVTGVFDVTQGRKPTGIEAASAIVELQEAAQTRLRLKVRNMEDSLRKIGNQIISLVQQFYTEERLVRVISRDGTPRFFVINAQTVDNEGLLQKVNDVTEGTYDVVVGVGSTLPISRTRKFAQMIQMFQLGIVDRRAVLEEAGVDNYEEILQRMELQQQAGAQAQAPQQGASQPGAGTQPPNPEAALGNIMNQMAESGRPSTNVEEHG